MRTCSSKNLILTVAAVALGFVAARAEARGNRREGFNFGTTVRLLDSDEKTTAGIGSDRNTKVSTSGQAVQPYLGYAFSSLNIGVSFLAEQQKSESVEKTEDGISTVTRRADRKQTGGNLFARFLFGNVFFFEAAGGIYQQTLDVATETKNLTDDSGNFNGATDEYSVNGIGPGYSVGAGLELPMGGNFYFTSEYQVRIVSLRDYNGTLSLGKKRSSQEKREALFGIAYYHQ